MAGPIRSRRFLGALAAVVFTIVGGRLVAADEPRGPAAEILGAEPGSEKAAIVARMQAEYEAALRRPRPPELGPPSEEWQPVIEPGVQDADGQEAVPKHAGLVISNWWQAGAIESGRLSQAYVGRENGQAIVILVSREVMAGTAKVTGQFPLPGAQGIPRFISGVNGTLEIEDSVGKRWLLQVAAGRLLAAP